MRLAAVDSAVDERPPLELVGVVKAFAGTPLLRQFDLEVMARRTTVLIGPSGCGKSSVLRLMIGLLRPDRGSVRFEGEEVISPGLQHRRRRMGYVIQEGGLFPHLTAAENAALAPRCAGWLPQRIGERLEQLAALVRLPIEWLARYPLQLSGGERQRVSLIRALMLDPAVLLLDEPLGALDPMVRAELQDDLREVFRALNKTVVMVTHDLAEAAFFADHVVLMRQGTIVQQGRFEELTANPANPFVEAFVRAQCRGLPVSQSPL
ncbi:MAG TPA: ATP-binding cassette domain-containing protein [Terriglobales bacterium]|nr:ATP-binding cassette domain-containing protein [Terriglobales bacterium]